MEARDGDTPDPMNEQPLSLLTILDRAEVAIQNDDWPALLPLVKELARYNLGLIATQSELAAKMYQCGHEFSKDARELAQEVLDIYRDLEELVADFKGVVRTRDGEELGEILDDFQTCHQDLEELKPQLDNTLKAEESSKLKLDEEFYLD